MTSLPNDGSGAPFSNGQFPASEAGDRGSVLSSRMTDIASEDGEDHAANTTTGSAIQSSQRRSVQTGTRDSISRPNTGVTGVSSQRGQWSHAPPSRRPFASAGAPQRGSIPGSIASSTTRPPSARSHVPSLSSSAFFRPMSSQRLQAQRSGARVAATSQQGMGEDGPLDGGTSAARTSMSSNQLVRQDTVEDGEVRPPPSPGTEFTEQDTTDRRTANTSSPTQGHRLTGSLTESVRPLQRNPNMKGLSLNTDKSYKNDNRVPAPAKSPHSFRSSFLMPTRGDTTDSPSRSREGREKLSSIASSPGMTPTNAPPKTNEKRPALGGNYQYFTGNTVFCWGGRLQNTRDKPINIATGGMVFVPAVLFFIFSAKWIWDNISPSVPIIFAYLFYICFSSFVHGSVTDPGVSLFLLISSSITLTSPDITSKSSSDASRRRE